MAPAGRFGRRARGVLSKKCLRRAQLADFAAAERAILAFIATYDAHHAHPFTWRTGVRFYQRLKDKLAAAQPTPFAAPQAA